VRLLPESGQVLLAAAILSASIIVRPAQPVIANPSPELPTVELQLTLTDLQPAVVNITQDPAVVEVTVVNPAPSVPNGEPVSIVVQPAPVLPAEIVYQDRTVEVERIVEVPACLDYASLPHFDLANALSAAFPGAQWGLSGSHYPGLDWTDPVIPKPDMTQIISGWLLYLAARC
jgi:hypothetical protein